MIKISDTVVAIDAVIPPTPPPQVYTLDQINQRIVIANVGLTKAQAELDRWTKLAIDAKALGVKTRAEATAAAQVVIDAQPKVEE